MSPSPNSSTEITVHPPAKLNLGLEIIGKRADGYHEIRSVMQAISLRDEMHLRLVPTTQSPQITIRGARADDPRLTLDGHGLADESNLVVRALRSLNAQIPDVGLARIEVELLKRIPPASGMGGASSDAATALRAGARLWGIERSDDELESLAVTLGADVPFFLHGGTASVSGIGEKLETLPDLTDVWFVVVFPLNLEPIPQKTVALYRALAPSDWSTGERVATLTDLIRRGQPLEPQLLMNAFERPLYELRPSLLDLREAMTTAGSSMVALSGAGPTHFSVEGDPERAKAIARKLQDTLGDSALIHVVAPTAAAPNSAKVVD